MKQIYSYVRDRKSGKRLGIVAAFGKDKVGWSKCSEYDHFDLKVGLAIALVSVEHPETFSNRKTPPQFKPIIEKMKGRSERAKVFN